MIKFIKRFIERFKEYFLLIVLIFISLTFISSNNKPQIKKIRTFALGNFAVVNEMVSNLISIFKSSPGIESLKKENAKLMLELNKIRNKTIENDRLRSMLGIKDSAHYPLISAEVISKLVNKVQGYFIINKGTEDSIRVGMPVISDNGLVGIISDTSGNYSVVKTLYNSNLNIAVTVQRINIDGVLSWNGSNLIIKNIPTTYDVRVGDIIETSDFSTILPPHIPVGVISERESIVIGLLHTISVEPYADIHSINSVFIINNVLTKQINKLEMNLMKK